MATVTLGSKGLINADLVLVQGASFSCAFIHEDENGDPIDHDGWAVWCRMQGRAGTVVLDDDVSFGDDGSINLNISDTETVGMAAGAPYKWDLIAEDATGYATRIAYGNATVCDSVARDG